MDMLTSKRTGIKKEVAWLKLIKTPPASVVYVYGRDCVSPIFSLSPSLTLAAPRLPLYQLLRGRVRRVLVLLGRGRLRRVVGVLSLSGGQLTALRRVVALLRLLAVELLGWVAGGCG